MGDAEFTLVEIVGYEVCETRTIISNKFLWNELLAVGIPRSFSFVGASINRLYGAIYIIVAILSYIGVKKVIEDYKWKHYKFDCGNDFSDFGDLDSNADGFSGFGEIDRQKDFGELFKELDNHDDNVMKD